MLVGQSLPRRDQPVPAAGKRRRGSGCPTSSDGWCCRRAAISTCSTSSGSTRARWATGCRKSAPPSARRACASAPPSRRYPPEQPSDLITVPGSGQTILYGKREQLTLSVASKLTQYWSIQGSETINLTNSTNIVNGIASPQSSSNSLNATLSAIYQDECMAFITTITQSGILNGDVRPGVSVVAKVVFKNSGEIGGRSLPHPPRRGSDLAAANAPQRQPAQSLRYRPTATLGPRSMVAMSVSCVAYVSACFPLSSFAPRRCPSRGSAASGRRGATSARA